MSDIRQLTPAACIFVVKQITTGNSPVSVGYRLVSNKGSTLSSQIQIFSPLFAYSHNIF